MSERQASTFRKGQFTDSHVKVLAYLNQLGVSYKAEEVVHTNMFHLTGRRISFKVDVLVIDSLYNPNGVIEVEGKGTNTNDEVRDGRLLRSFSNGILWIEHLPNKEVSLLAVSDILARHGL